MTGKTPDRGLQATRTGKAPARHRHWGDEDSKSSGRGTDSGCRAKEDKAARVRPGVYPTPTPRRFPATRVCSSPSPSDFTTPRPAAAALISHAPHPPRSHRLIAPPTPSPCVPLFLGALHLHLNSARQTRAARLRPRSASPQRHPAASFQKHLRPAASFFPFPAFERFLNGFMYVSSSFFLPARAPCPGNPPPRAIYFGLNNRNRGLVNTSWW